VLKHLVDAGKEAVSFDLSDNRARLNLLLSTEVQEAIRFIKGDLTDSEQVKAVMAEHDISHVLHLAALQVPLCRADPILGAQVNVVGTVNIFEAARAAGIKHLGLASSLAVYGPAELYPAGLVSADAVLHPNTLYGVYKQANEGTARIYWQDHGISSVSLRPYTVYGVARDQGLTSEPSKAMLAAAKGEDYAISFGGRMQFHLASDVAKQFIEAAEKPADGAKSFNLGTAVVAVSEIAAMIQELKPGVHISSTDTLLPFPEGLEAADYQSYTEVQVTPLKEGVRQTIEHFEDCLAQGLLS
jgi:nucleoside-diphosphate-sugar epimerase